ncbi:MAG: repeat protein, partial [Myxococcaceae bacterium]|nr:repeat protein [Myxococcaceae bacterium]
HTHFDVPTLVFGVLLDELPERSLSERVQVERFEAAASKLAPLFSTPQLSTSELATLPQPSDLPVTGLVSARMRESRDSGECISPRGSESEQQALELPREPRLPRELLDDEHYLAQADDDQTDEERRGELPGEPTKKALVALPTELLIYAEAKLPASAADSAPAMCVDDAEVLPHAAEDSLEHASEEGAAALAASASSEPLDEDSTEPDAEPADAQGDASLLALRVRALPAHLRALFRAPVARLQGLRQRLEPALREQAEYFDLPDAKTRFLLQLARLRALLLQSWSKVQRSTGRAGPRAPRALRVQRSTLLGLGPADSERAEPARRVRAAAIAFAVLGVGLCVYALAPRSSADRIKLPERVQGQTEPPPAEQSELSDDELDLKDEPVELEVAPKRKRGAARDPAVAAAAAVIAAEAAKPVLSAPFGEADIPNGRVFTLRMNGPVHIVEGEVRDNGITVRVPGRQALDRASPIASSHSAVQRAMILNRGGFAELTIDFVPGTAPHYQVRGKDNTLEVTLERL